VKLLFLEVMALAEPGYADDSDAATVVVQQYTAAAGLDCTSERAVLTAVETEVSLLIHHSSNAHLITLVVWFVLVKSVTAMYS
jgi:hypothetical protein